MVVKEIKEAVIDMINFIIPPFVRVVVSYFFLQYITYGQATANWPSKLISSILSIKLDFIKSIIDKLYLSSVVPIIFILLIIVAAYTINRTTSFIGSLVPIKFVTHSSLYFNIYYTKSIWRYFPEISSLDRLGDKIKSISKSLEINDSLDIKTQLKYLDEEFQKEFRYLNFSYFLLLGSIVVVYVSHNYYHLVFNNTRLLVFDLLLLLLSICFYMRIANIEERKVFAKLFYVENFLRNDSGVQIVDNPEADKKIDEMIAEQAKYHKKWWRIEFGYNFGWLNMYKSYDVFPRFRMLKSEIAWIRADRQGAGKAFKDNRANGIYRKRVLALVTILDIFKREN
jgi:hypothetical protein